MRERFTGAMEAKPRLEFIDFEMGTILSYCRERANLSMAARL